jgi:demethylmenaquinone methyltransferase / 2-methoxy-6-polyprenyl-1,4-benzoquinol methylase
MPRNAADFAWQHDDVFGRIATQYDLLCDVFSLGIHRLWKRRVAQLIASEHWATLLDGATGTGDIITRLLAHKAVLGRTVVASYVSTKMLAITQRKLAPLGNQVQVRQLGAESMPTVADSSVDAMSFGLKICNRGSALKEAYRVLRPGGWLVILEASNIPWLPLHWAYLAYMSVCMPVFCWLVTGGDSSAYRYLLHGIREFPSAEALAAEIGDHGSVFVPRVGRNCASNQKVGSSSPPGRATVLNENAVFAIPSAPAACLPPGRLSEFSGNLVPR